MKPKKNKKKIKKEKLPKEVEAVLKFYDEEFKKVIKSIK